MRSTLATLAFVAAAVFAGELTFRVHASTGPIPLNCDRACLEGVVNQYLAAAVVTHDPRAPAALRGRHLHRERSGDQGGRRLLEDGGGRSATTSTSSPIRNSARWR